MAELALLGVVGNICQIIDFGQKLIFSAAELYQSASGVSQESVEIELIERNFKYVRSQLKESSGYLDDQPLMKICKACDDVAEDLLKEVSKLRVPREGRKDITRKIDCLWKAAQGAWGKDYIEKHQKKLNALKTELHLQLTADLRSRVLKFSEDYPRQREALNSLEQTILKSFRDHTGVVEAIEQRIQMLNLSSHEETRSILQQQQILEKLPIAPEAEFSSYERTRRPTCLTDTRVEILAKIKEWADDDHQETLFWLRGFAGIGKSTIAQTVACSYSEQGRLGANFFFSQDLGGDVRRSRKLFTSIAWQLAQFSKEIKSQISEAIAENEGIITQGLAKQWQKLILGPLSRIKVDVMDDPILILIDALDECDDSEDIELITRLLPELGQLKNMKFKIFITSRPESFVRDAFGKISENDFQILILHSVPRVQVDEDISLLFRNEFAAIREKQNLPKDWPGSRDLEVVVQRAGGLFVWADTACRFVRNGGIFTLKRFKKLLENDLFTTAPEKGLDNLYLTVLEDSISTKYVKYEDDEIEEFCRILNLIFKILVISFSSLSISSLNEISGVGEYEISEMLSNFHAILDIHEEYDYPIQLHHPSFRDFLLNEKRCKDDRFLVNEQEAHSFMAIACIRVMSSGLKKDICGLRSPGVLAVDVCVEDIEEHLPDILHYACQYWAYHVHRSSSRIESTSNVHVFLQQHLTHWLEALSLLGKLSESVTAISLLSTLVEEDSDACRLIEDSHQFIKNNLHMVEVAPLQVYCSALLFSPSQSLVRKLFGAEIPNGFKLLTEPEITWSSVLQVLDCGPSSIRDLRFSPDSKILATATDGVNLWNIETGTQNQALDFDGTNLQAIFSPDMTLVALTHYYQTISIYGTTSMTKVCGFKASSDHIGCITFSPDSKFIATLSYEETFKMLDLTSGVTKCEFECRTEYFSSVVFSHNGRLVSWIDGRHNEELKICNVTQGNLFKTLVSDDYYLRILAFSPDDEHLITCTENCTVRLWSIDAETLVHKFELDQTFGSISSAISPNCELLLNVIGNQDAYIWDIRKGELAVKLETGEACVGCIIFSPDSKMLVTATTDYMIRFWDIELGNLCRYLRNFSCRVERIEYSPNGKLLASGACDGVVRIWDLSSNDGIDKAQSLKNEAEGIPYGYYERATSMTMLSRSKSIAVGNDNGSISIWHLEEGTISKQFDAQSAHVTALEGSPDDERLVAAYSDKMIRLWNVQTEKEPVELEATEKLWKICFSPNGEMFVATNDDDPCTIEFRNGHTAELLKAITIRVSYFRLAFSSNNDFFVLAARNELQIWNTASINLLYTVDCGDYSVQSIAISPCNKIAAYQVGNDKIHIRRVLTNEKINTTEIEDANILTIAYSPVNRFMASSLWDESIVVWDRVDGLKGRFSAGIRVERMNFSADGQVLETDRGKYCLDCNIADEEEPKRCERGCFHVDETWLVGDPGPLLWLPPDYRANAVIIWGEYVAIRARTFKFVLLKIDVKEILVGA